jgi:hypothetical protein
MTGDTLRRILAGAVLFLGFLAISLLAPPERAGASVHTRWNDYSGGRRKLGVRIAGTDEFQSAVRAAMERWNSALAAAGVSWRFCETTGQDYQVFIRVGELPASTLGETAPRTFLNGDISHCNVTVNSALSGEERDIAITHELGHCMRLEDGYEKGGDIDDVMTGGGMHPTARDVSEALASDKDPPPCPYAIAPPESPYVRKGTAGIIRLAPRAGTGISHAGVERLAIEPLTGPEVAIDERSIQWDESSIIAFLTIGDQADHNEVIKVTLVYSDRAVEYTGILTITEDDAPPRQFPHAVAGADIVVASGAPVLLDGRQSYHDLATEPIAGNWMVKTRDGATVGGLFSDHGTVLLDDGVYDAVLEVRDYYGRSSEDALSIEVGGAPPDPSCPRQGDTHCLSLKIDPPRGAAGTYFATADAIDEGGEPVFYTFVATNLLETHVAGPQYEPVAELHLGEGIWTITASADDDPDCRDAAPDASCAVEIELRAVGGGQVPSDANQDGVADISDAASLLGHLFLDRPPRLPCGDGSADDPGNLLLLDANGDGRIDLSDAVYELGFLFLGTPPPVLGTLCRKLAGCPDHCLPSPDPNDPGLLRSWVYEQGACGSSGEIHTNRSGADIEVLLSIANRGKCDIEVTAGAKKLTVSAGGVDAQNFLLGLKNGERLQYDCKALEDSACEVLFSLRQLGVGRPPDGPALPNALLSSTYHHRACGDTGTLFTNKLDRSIDLVLRLLNLGQCDVKTTAGATAIEAKPGASSRATLVRLGPGESWSFACSQLADKECEFFWSVGELGLSTAGSTIAESNFVGVVPVATACLASDVLFKNTLPDAVDLSVKVVNLGFCDLSLSATGAGELIKRSHGRGLGLESETVAVSVPPGGEIAYACSSAADVNYCAFQCVIRQVPKAATGSMRADGWIAYGGLQDATAKNCGEARGEVFVNRLADDLEVNVIVANNGFHCPVRVFLDDAEILSAGPAKSERKPASVRKNGGRLRFVCETASAEDGPCLFFYYVTTRLKE